MSETDGLAGCLALQPALQHGTLRWEQEEQVSEVHRE